MTYHYLIGVRRSNIGDDEPNKLDLDFFLEYTNEDISNAKDAKEASKNELFPINTSEAGEMFKVSELIESFNACLVRTKIHDMLMCHYYSEFKLDRDFFKTLIKTSSLDELKKADVTNTKQNKEA